jgi:hypothetical protein
MAFPDFNRRLQKSCELQWSDAGDDVVVGLRGEGGGTWAVAIPKLDIEEPRLFEREDEPIEEAEMTPEGKVVAGIKALVKSMGGEVRKCQWVGHNGAPDLFIMLNGRHLWIEVKAPGKKPQEHQMREMKRMCNAGCAVFVTDSVEGVQELLEVFNGAR